MPIPNRIDSIRKIVASRPDDPFPRYGLAIELRNQERYEEAHAEFVELERRAPDYVAQYLMHQQVLVKLRRKEDARAVCLRGIEAARQKGDAHAQSELQGALDDLDFIEE